MEQSIAFVCLMGIGTVFVGLICIIILCSIIGKICGAAVKEETSAPAPSPAPASATQSAQIPNKKKIIAAVSAVIAEELGTEVSAIRVKSFKKL